MLWTLSIVHWTMSDRKFYFLQMSSLSTYHTRKKGNLDGAKGNLEGPKGTRLAGDIATLI